MTFREEDPATSSQPFYVQGRERLRTRGERNQAAAMAEAIKVAIRVRPFNSREQASVATTATVA